MVGKEKRTKSYILTGVGIIIALYVLFPFFLVVLNSFKAQASIVESPVSFKGASFGQLMKNLNAVINNSNFQFWYAFGTSAVIASMIIPFQVVMLPLISTFRDVGKFIGISMLQSIPGIVFAYCGFGGAMTVFILTGFIKGVPYDLEEAAAIDGCSPEGTFFRIILPLLTPVITTVTILNGMWIWNDYLLPSLMLGQNGKVKTLPVAVQAFVGSYVKQWDLILTAALLAIIPMVVIFLIGQKQIMNGMVEGAVKG